MPRTPLIPGITNTKKNLSAIVSLYREEKVKKTQLMAYHPLWQNKNQKIGIISFSTKENKMGEGMPKEELKECEKAFIDAGIFIEN